MNVQRTNGRRTRLLRLVGVWLGLWPWAGVPLAAGQAPATNLTLTAAVDLAVRDNAQLQSLRAKWGAMQERPAQAGALSNPMFKYSGMDLADGGRWPNTDEKRFMIEQEFPWLGKRGLRAGIAAKDAEIMQRELEAMTRDVVMMVKETYFQRYALQQVRATTRQDEEVLQRMAQIAETMYATGARTQQDVLKAKSEITMLQQRLLELDAQEATLAAKLNTLLNRRADAPLGAAATPPDTGFTGNAETLFALAATNRPEVRAAQAQVARYDLERRLMAKENWPDYSLGLEYRNFGNSDDMLMLTVGIELPIWKAKSRAGVREAEKMKVSSQMAREAAERQSALDVQDAAFRLRTARRSLDLYRTELIPQAEARFKASETSYQTGKVDFMDLLESQRFLLNVRVMAAMAGGDLGMQSARLERAVGTELGANVKAGEPSP
ncbi:MAG: TolC family protein [Kiritimatiellaeota bacterium]|nr:TolC family protein [Kiritimatiellota bacterium]